VLDRPRSGTGNWPGRDVNYASTPPMRDTVAVMPNSYAVLRFKANNPGVWLFHCHIEWHVEMGLTATVIEAPDRLRSLTFPDDHIAACKKMGIPYQGNAAGNTQDVTDTTGFITVPPTNYTGSVILLLSLPLSFALAFQNGIPTCHACNRATYTPTDQVQA
jgi:iron transport multicopper oxidase